MIDCMNYSLTDSRCAKVAVTPWVADVPSWRVSCRKDSDVLPASSDVLPASPSCVHMRLFLRPHAVLGELLAARPVVGMFCRTVIAHGRQYTGARHRLPASSRSALSFFLHASQPRGSVAYKDSMEIT